LPNIMGGIWSFRYTSGIVERTLDALGLRQRVIAHNVANLNTPGYYARQVDFAAELQRALYRDGFYQGRTETRFGEAPRFNYGHSLRPGSVTAASPFESGVDMDVEMVDLAKTNILYNSMVTLTNSLYGRVHQAIKEGRG